MRRLRPKQATRNDQRKSWLPVFARLVIRTSMACFGVFLLAVLILWNADFYSARDNWEHFKLAVFGEWQQENWCPSGRKTLLCQQVNDFQEVFESMDDFHFFKTVAVEGAAFSVVTGVNFSAAEDVLSRNSLRHWCYIQYGSTSVSNKMLELGSREGNAPPDYPNLNGLSTTDETEIGFNANQLRAIAQSHCRFDLFNQQNEGE